MGGTSVPRLEPSATVWRLRQDLVIQRGADPSRVVVQGPRGVLELHEAELSVARMLDGRRHVGEVLDNAARLGIPADLPGLARLIGLLERHGCIAKGEALADDEGPRTTWAPRRQWTDAVRTLFQNAVRLMRLGALAEARAQLDALLELEPDLDEAKDLLALVAQGRGLEAPPVGYGRGEPRRGVIAGLVVAGAMAVVLAGSALWLVLAHVGAPVPMNPLIVPGPALWTDAGDGRRATEALTPTAVRIAPAGRTTDGSAPIERRWHPLLAQVRAPRTGRLEWERPSLATVARGERLGFVGDDGPESPALLAARARVSELTRLVATDPIYAEFLEREKAEVARQEAASRQVVIAAAGGTLVPVARAGPVRLDEVLAEIHDGGSWSVAATMDAAPIVGASCEVVGGAPAERVPCRVTDADAKRGRWVVQALVLAPAAWLASDGEASLHLAGSPR